MTEPAAVTVAETVRWLHEEGLARLAGIAQRMPNPLCAYTIDVATGSVTGHPVTGVGLGSDVLTLTADDLPYPVGTSKRLVVVGVTLTESILVVDLAVAQNISVNAFDPVRIIRSWVAQLLLNREVALTTNSADFAVPAGDRCVHAFLPGTGGTVINVDDRHPPITTIALNSNSDGPDHLDVDADGVGEMYLGARYWALRTVFGVNEPVWAALTETLDDRTHLERST
ncbi:hypothetical protein [Nocardia sp. NPDC051832]|uniref:hypothetical protein n=1 Tax=Nocardia sp. NPDC051832 TaxID=3155673 RepID=UPI0034452112